MFCITSRRYGDNAKQHRFDYIIKQSSVFFSICLTGCFYNDNEQAAFVKVECLNVCACGAEAITGFIPLPTVEATPLGHEDNRNCKRSAFICVHSIKKLSLLFCKIRQKNRMHLSAVCFNFAQHNNEQTLHTLENTGFKTNQFGLVKEYIWG